LEADLRIGLAKGEFYLYYQPIIALDNLRLVGFEGLLRWRHPDRGLLTPDKFIHIAEEIGLIETINFLALKTACQQLQQWRKVSDLEPELFMSVNLSPLQLEDKEYIAYIKAILKEYNLPTSTIKIEITESGFSEQTQTIDWVLQQIDILGIKLCIDDFGTGYSSLSRLHTLPISTLKIDRSFVSRLDAPDGLEIVQTIITFAHNLEMDIVAEGIETKQQLEVLQKMGCELGQGYLFSPPVSNEKAAQFIINSTLAFNPE
jgi:EAL domain-containing protein (putative c-di-GMP-specific phosphodiesterase class I)